MPLQARPKIVLPAFNRIGKVTRLGHDFETYSDEDVTDIGSDAYSRHPSTEVLMCSYVFDDGPVKQWVPIEGDSMPAELEDAIRDERVIKTCWNKAFEWSIWANCLGIETPHEAWQDTMVLSFSLALPGSLEKAGEVLGLEEDKKKAALGRALIRLFCQPRKPTKNKPWRRTLPAREPVKWEEFKNYNRQDTVAERAALKKLRVFGMPEHEWEMWVIDQIINQAGIPMNMRAVEAAIKLYERTIENRIDRLKLLTELENPNSNSQMLDWLQLRGYPFDDMKKGHVDRAKKSLETRIETFFPGVDDPEEREQDIVTAEVLSLRQDVARASPKKFYAIQRQIDRIMGVLRNQFQFAGAGRTWRWAGRVFQPQNLPRPDKLFKKIIDAVVAELERMDPESIDLIYDPMKLLVSVIRAMAQAGEGFLLFDADLNAIENRMLGWQARDRKILRVFELGRDPYIDFATYLYHATYEILWREYDGGKGDDSKRTVAKPAVLGCGYQLSAGEEHINQKTGEIEATGLLGYARNMGIILTPEQAQLSVKTFRETYTEVVDFWHEIERAAKKCVRTGNPTNCNMIRFDIKSPFLRMILPSGRALHYCRPRLEMVKTPWGAMREQLTYEGLDDRNQWVRIPTHGGKLTENADQAMARDVLAGGLRRAYYAGLDIRMHVHDQIIGLAPADEANDHLKLLRECMTAEEPWHTYRGIRLPLGTAGFTSKVFKKD